jgi:assimilatory nitrate reductase catalytic subunit
MVRELAGIAADTPLLSMEDPRTGRHSYALFDGDALAFALFVSPDPVLVSRQWAAGLLTQRFDDLARRSRILAGRPGADVPDPGPIVCACNNVGAHDIGRAIARGCHSVEAVGTATKAGSNCGSCRAEIRVLIEAAQAAASTAVR